MSSLNFLLPVMVSLITALYPLKLVECINNNISVKTGQNLLTTIRFGVTSRGRAPSTGVAGALPLRHAFSYEVSEEIITRNN